MILKDLHIHTTFSDGKNTPEEIIEYAINKGIETIGFSDHSYTFFDESYCASKENIEKYIIEVLRLKEKYKNKIEILLGIEQDYFSKEPTDRFEYVIGSVHYIKVAQEYIAVDYNMENFAKSVEKYFGGDYYKFVAEYFNTVANVVEKTNADIIGHFDLVAKYNENNAYFDESDPRYVASYKECVDKLIKCGKPFEINTGPISRGYRSVPYPNTAIYNYIKSKGGKFILSSDSHRADTLCNYFDKFEKLL